MNSTLHVMSVFGTRPEAVKMAPLVKALDACPGIRSTCCVTGQHREMLDGVLGAFGITPDVDLDIMTGSQTVGDVTVRTLTGMEGVFAERRPDLALVHGDTTTAFASALAAFYSKIPVGHVEAGLRTGDRYSPYPEEMNRRLITRLSTLHFCPTEQNRRALESEGVGEGIVVTGNTVIDAMKETVRGNYAFDEPVLNSLDFSKNRVLLVTAHRRENYGEAFESIFGALSDITGRFDDVRIVYPVHPAPAVREAASRLLGGNPRISLIEPLGLLDMHNLMARCFFVLTDSGGLQEEAPALGRPVLVLRRETERPEAVEAGTVKLAGVDRAHIAALASELLTDGAAYESMSRAVSPYGDGNACPRIVKAILDFFEKSSGEPAK